VSELPAQGSEWQEGYDEPFDVGNEINSELLESRWDRIVGRAGYYATVVGLAVAANLAPTGTADAAEPTCYGDYCSGQYADATNCDDDAVTIATRKITQYTYPGLPIDGTYIEKEVGTLELRRSPTCKTKWARVDTFLESEVKTVGVQKRDGYTQERRISVFGTSPPGKSYSPMIYDGGDEGVRAYVQGHDVNHNSTTWK